MAVGIGGLMQSVAGADNRSGAQQDPYAFHYGGQKGFAGSEAGRYEGKEAGYEGRRGEQIGTEQADVYRDYNKESRGMAYGARGSQQNALGLMQSAAEGNQPSQAAMQMAEGNREAIRGQMAMANSARGGNFALAQRNAAGNASEASAQNVQRTGQLRAQEMAEARQAYMGGATGMRGQDINQQGADLAGQSQNFNQSLAQAQMNQQQRGMNDEQARYMEGLRAQGYQSETQAGLYGQNLAAQAAAQNSQQSNDWMAGLVGGLSNAAGSLSDERAKMGIKPAGSASESMINSRDEANRMFAHHQEEQARQTGLMNFDKSQASSLLEGGSRSPVGGERMPSMFEMGANENQPMGDYKSSFLENGKNVPGGESMPGMFDTKEQQQNDRYAQLKARSKVLGRDLSAGTTPEAPGDNTAAMKDKLGAGNMNQTQANMAAQNESATSGAGATAKAPTSPSEADKEGQKSKVGGALKGFSDAFKKAQHGGSSADTYINRLSSMLPNVGSGINLKTEIEANPLTKQPDEVYGPDVTSGMPSSLAEAAASPMGGFGGSTFGGGGEASNSGGEPMPGAGGDTGGGEFGSDERIKEGKHKQTTEADAFLDTLHPYSYKYKDPENEPSSHPTGGRYLGVMAQDVERGPTGHTIVKDTPKGKMLEGGSLMSALAAGMGRLNERIRELEGRRHGRS